MTIPAGIRRLLAQLEARAPKASDELQLTAGLTDAEIAAAYKRHLAGESWQEIFPDAELPDDNPEIEAALARIQNDRDAYEAYRQMLRGCDLVQAVNIATKGRL